MKDIALDVMLFSMWGFMFSFLWALVILALMVMYPTSIILSTLIVFFGSIFLVSLIGMSGSILVCLYYYSRDV